MTSALDIPIAAGGFSRTARDVPVRKARLSKHFRDARLVVRAYDKTLGPKSRKFRVVLSRGLPDVMVLMNGDTTLAGLGLIIESVLAGKEWPLE